MNTENRFRHSATWFVAPNTIIKNEPDFYISYNDHDKNIYGDVTTAIVTQKNKQPDKFYILNWDHRDQLKDKDLKGCLEYFIQNIHHVNKKSDRVVNGKFIPRKFKGRFNEKGLDDLGASGLTFEVKSLIKDKVYEEQDPEYLEGKRVGVVIDDNGCWWYYGTPSFDARFELIKQMGNLW